MKLQRLFIIVLLVCCMGTDDCNRTNQIEWATQLASDIIYIGDPVTDLCFAVFPNGNSTWGGYVPCTKKVCENIQGQKPEICRSLMTTHCN